MIAMPGTLKVADPSIQEIGFVRVELRVGLTMCRLAMKSHSPDKARRNRVAARKAYDAVVRFMPRVGLTSDEATEISAKLARLKSELRQLGEEI
jgi:hypothetical protein